MRKTAVALLALCALAMGCGPSASDASQRDKAAEFSEEGFENAMVESGKQDELDAAKQREQEYLAASGGDTDDQQQN